MRSLALKGIVVLNSNSNRFQYAHTCSIQRRTMMPFIPLIQLRQDVDDHAHMHLESASKLWARRPRTLQQQHMPPLIGHPLALSGTNESSRNSRQARRDPPWQGPAACEGCTAVTTPPHYRTPGAAPCRHQGTGRRAAARAPGRRCPQRSHWPRAPQAR